MIDVNKLGTDFYYARTPESFTLFYKEVRPFLLNWTTKKYNNRSATVEDIVDCSLEKVYAKIDQYNPKYRFSSWLFQIVSNDFNKHYNKHTKKEIPWEDVQRTLENTPCETEYIDVDDEELKLVKDIKAVLQAPDAMLLLGKYHKFKVDMFLEYCSTDMTCADIAKKYHIHKSSIVKYFFEIRRAMYQVFNDENMYRKVKYQIQPYVNDDKKDVQDCV
jgi:RNA polymerase sigma-70 factor (ECF subfamily)